MIGLQAPDRSALIIHIAAQLNTDDVDPSSNKTLSPHIHFINREAKIAVDTCTPIERLPRDGVI